MTKNEAMRRNMQDAMNTKTIGTATYDPSDNKLRLTPHARLDAETYALVKAAGYCWAPKQKIFIAPMWTPARHDLAIRLCGEIGDEDESLIERAEERAERFEGYQERRADDATQARERVEQLCDGVPFGQPVLVGHHSERHARKTAKRMEQGMRQAVNMWETSEYWKRRAAGVIRSAKYKDLPAVRARRIKGLEADKRKQERDRDDAALFIRLWGNPSCVKSNITGEIAPPLTWALHIASREGGGAMRWSRLTDGKISPEDAAIEALDKHTQALRHAERWIAHYDNRIEYERAMLDEQGAATLLDKKPRTAALPCGVPEIHRR